MNRCICFFLLLASPAISLAAETINTSLSFGITHDDNINLAEDNHQIMDDSIFNLGAQLNYNLALNNNNNLLFTLEILNNTYQDFDKLTHNNLSLKVEYQFQLANHYTAPWYFASLKSGSLAYDSNDRDASYIEIAFGFGKRLTDKMDLYISLNSSSTDADSRYFDTDNNQLSASLNFKFSNHTLYTTLGYLTGDMTVTVGSPYPANLTAYYPSHGGDDAFNGTSVNSPWAYLVDVDTISLTLGDTYNFTSQHSLNVSVHYYDASAFGGISYNGIITTMNYNYNF